MIAVVQRVLLLALVAFAAVGCHAHGRSRRPEGDDPTRWAEQLRSRLARNPGDVQARRDLAHVEWLHLGHTEAALAELAHLTKDGDTAARLARLLIADGRLDTAATSDEAYALLREAGMPAARSGSDQAWLRRAAAEVAARRIAALHGERDGDDARFVALFDGLDLGALGTAARQTLLSVRANIARTQGQDYAPFYRAQGCVQRWEVGPMQGVRAELELAHVEGPFTRDPSAAAVELACVIRLWNPREFAGIRRIRTYLDVPGELLQLEVSAEEPTRVWLDGKLVHRTDLTDRFPRSRTTLELPVDPGSHELEVATTISRDKAWVLVRANSPDGSEVKVSTTGARGRLRGAPRRSASAWESPRAPLDGPIYAPLRAMLAAEDAIGDGDVDAAELQIDRLAQMPVAAEGQLVIAMFERFDPSRGRTVSAAREQAALQRALATDPASDAARLRTLELMLERGEDSEAEATLDKLPAARLHSVSGELLRFRVHLQRGDERRADAAIERASKLARSNCRVLAAQRSRARDRGDVAREDAITAALASCSGTLELRAQLAERRGRFDEARALLAEAMRRVPDDLDTVEMAARVAATAGDVAGAKTLLAQVLERNPLRVSAHVMLADLAAAADDAAGARAQLAQALARIPHADPLHRAQALLGTPDELEQLRVDGLAALADYRRSRADDEGASEVLVLDRSAARVYANGGQRQIVHLVVELRSKAALDRYGELDIPEAARLLTLRTIKPDGTVVEAESVPGKDGVSLRDLAIGDVVEYEFVIERDPATALPGYVDVSTFRFQSLDVPYHRSELLVVAPAAMPIREDRRNGAPEPVIGEMRLGGEALATRLYRAREVPRRGEEPGHRALLDELPNVRVYTALDVRAYLDGLALTIRRGQRSNVELRRRVRRLTAGRKDPRAKLDALWRWVVENVEDGGDLSTPATATLAARAGSRLMLLRAMLREAGIEAELWLARDRFGAAPLPGGHPMLEEYDAALLAVRVGGKDPLMVLTASKVMPLGYLSPSYAGTAGLRVHLEDGDGPSGAVVLPQPPTALVDRRSWKLDIAVAKDGAAEIAGRITLTGVDAIAWRQALREVDRDRIREVFQQAELGWLRGGTLRELEILEEKAIDRPLVLKFSADAPQFAIRQGDALMLRASPLPLSTAARYTTLPTRTTGLVVPVAPALEADVTYAVTGGVLEEVPDPAVISGRFGRYERSLVAGGRGKDSVHLVFRSTVVPGVITTDAYADFAAFGREVDEADQALVRASERR